MKWLVVILSVLALGACRDDRLARPDPVEMTPEAVGFYCQMTLLEHAGPKAQIHLDGMPAPIFFSQVRDAIAYLQMPEQNYAVTATYVQDMSGATWDAPGGWVEVSEPIYVIDSDMRGGMGAPEFVPFTDPSAAQAFVRDHGGRLKELSDISTAEALGPDGRQIEPPDENTSDIEARLSALSAQKQKGN
ncbi:nitrous oxide reductase accessory protein NosL [Celeribacter neptunius]|uniref:Copper chaperone NosL n=1 Tax=Celeribacter neptunius TaxID=588602 RepID=A0A1I3R930_9RHOB|nr:nitrous oxide reductase accessory protein NosL [Celeribacter neptunius]SFJ42282.1 copper chaperone NosL [Celeribacter neptunius]